MELNDYYQILGVFEDADTAIQIIMLSKLEHPFSLQL